MTFFNSLYRFFIIFFPRIFLVSSLKLPRKQTKSLNTHTFDPQLKDISRSVAILNLVMFARFRFLHNMIRFCLILTLLDVLTGDIFQIMTLFTYFQSSTVGQRKKTAKNKQILYAETYSSPSGHFPFVSSYFVQ